MSELPEK